MNIFKKLFSKIYTRYSNYKLIKANIPFINPSDDKIYMMDEYQRHDNVLNKDEVIQIINPRKKKWDE